MRSVGSHRRGPQLPALVLMVLTLVVAGCAAPRQATVTQRSGVEQALLVRSLERAVAGLDVSRLLGRRVVLDLFALTGDQTFAREFVTVRLQRRGLDIIGDTTQADIRLKVFANVLGVDRGETLIGIPALQAPIVSIPIPEIALFKWVRHRGFVELQLYAYDPRTDQLVEGVAAALGHAKYDEFKVLLVIGFVVSDIDERAEPVGPEPH